MYAAPRPKHEGNVYQQAGSPFDWDYLQRISGLAFEWPNVRHACGIRMVESVEFMAEYALCGSSILGTFSVYLDAMYMRVKEVIQSLKSGLELEHEEELGVVVQLQS